MNDVDFLSKVDLIDRKSFSRGGSSMPVSYLGAWTYIRELFGALPEAQVLGFSARSFSLQSTEGRCELCSGRGQVSLNMRFLPDAKILCSACSGSRYKDLILTIKYRDKSINDILKMTFDEACGFFKYHPKLIKLIEPAKNLGLDLNDAEFNEGDIAEDNSSESVESIAAFKHSFVKQLVIINSKFLVF